MCERSINYLPVYFTVTGFDSCVTVSVITELKPDILHLYSAKSLGHWTLSLSMVSFSVAELSVLISDPAVEARSFNVDDPWGHWIWGVWSLIIETAVSKLVLLFLWSCMKNKELNCEGLVIEHWITKSFSP